MLLIGGDAMPIEYPVDFKRKIIRRYEKENPSRNLVKSFILHRARFTIGVSYSVLFRRRSIPTRPKNLMCFRESLRKWSMKWRSFAFPDFLPKCRSAGNLKSLEKTYRENQQFSVHELCEALGVARGTFYNHIFRRVDRSKREEEQAELMLKGTADF